jgi:hypothetical protein
LCPNFWPDAARTIRVGVGGVADLVSIGVDLVPEP